MSEDSGAQRLFTEEDQRRFAELSGDANPLHLDPVAARRLLFGQPVVHGIHTLLWCLDRLAGEIAEPFRLEELSASFRRPVFLGQVVRVVVARGQDGRFLVETDGARCRAQGRIRRNDHPGGAVDLPRWPPSAPICRERSFEEAAAAEGTHPLWLDPERFAAMLPALATCLPASQAAALLAATRLTGMECPGRHTIFDSLALRFAAPAGEPWWRYRTAAADRRFSLVRLEVSGFGAEGELTTFYRPRPVEQPSLDEVAARVPRGWFAGQRALVVGGSRGLGELTAKILGAGGAELRLTYHLGREDAQRVVEQLRQRGTLAECFPLDVTADEPAALSSRLGDWRPTHVYYFATPRIQLVGDEPADCSSPRYEQFVRYYVDGFARVLEGCDIARQVGLHVFYPSTRAIDAPGRMPPAYIAAKAAGENLCRALAGRFPGCRFAVPRLPALRTDQTALLLPCRAEDPLPVMLTEVAALISDGG